MSESRNKLKFSFISVIIILLTLYVIYQSKNFLIGPGITIEKPHDGQTLQVGLFEIKGNAKNVAYIYLNDNQIFVDKEGKFSEKLIAPRGYFIIKITIKDRFGRSKEKLIHLIGNGEVDSTIATSTNN